jgi:hypothetical protein
MLYSVLQPSSTKRGIDLKEKNRDIVKAPCWGIGPGLETIARSALFQVRETINLEGLQHEPFFIHSGEKVKIFICSTGK